MSITSDEIRKLVEEVYRILDLMATINDRVTVLEKDVEELKRKVEPWDLIRRDIKKFHEVIGQAKAITDAKLKEGDEANEKV